MKKDFLVVCFLVLSACFLTTSVFGEESRGPNNKFGVHILFPNELEEAAALVNSNGGDYGYVTIPIQAGDRDLQKWQEFMDKAGKLHVIPLIRLATEGDYFNTKVWRKPTNADILDFANFLNSLEWPTKNRYIIVFNEVNRGDEWGGQPNASEYATLLSYASILFKTRNKDFLILTSGLDNASATVPGLSINEYEYLDLMNQEVPGIFDQVDGLASHSYPNPGFFKSSKRQDSESIASFMYEKNLVKSLGTKDLPIFITETGWSLDAVSDEQASLYFKDAFSTVWNRDDVLAVTPFLLQAYAKPFSAFSLIRADGTKSLRYKAIQEMPKIKGSPELSEKAPPREIKQAPSQQQKTFSTKPSSQNPLIRELIAFKTLLKWFLKI